MKTITVAQLLSRASVLILYLGMVSLTEAEYLRQLDQQLVSLPDDDLQLAVKRPFCNAFTGCGRKRSSMPSVGSELMDSDNDEPDSDAVQAPSDAFYRNLGERIMRMRSASIHPWNHHNSQQNQLRTPWLGYLSERKKRMAVVNNGRTKDGGTAI